MKVKIQTRSLNVQLIDMAILQRGWGRERAALEIGIDHQTLLRIYRGQNPHNDVIFKVSKALNISFDKLIVWRDSDGKEEQEQEKQTQDLKQ